MDSDEGSRLMAKLICVPSVSGDCTFYLLIPSTLLLWFVCRYPFMYILLQPGQTSGYHDFFYLDR